MIFWDLIYYFRVSIGIEKRSKTGIETYIYEAISYNKRKKGDILGNKGEDELGKKLLIGVFAVAVLVLLVLIDGSNSLGSLTAQAASSSSGSSGGQGGCVQGWRCLGDNQRAYQYKDCTWYPNHSPKEKANKWSACTDGKICQSTATSIECVKEPIPIQTDISIKIPSSFSLVKRQTAKVVNYQDMKIKLTGIFTNPVTNPECVSDDPTKPCPGAYFKEYVNVEISTPGGCGPNADPRCLGPPGFSNEFTIREGESIEVLGIKLTLRQVGKDKADFYIESLSKKEPVCGNNICEEGEAPFCPGGDIGACSRGTCPEDCEEAKTEKICPKGTNLCADGTCKAVCSSSSAAGGKSIPLGGSFVAQISDSGGSLVSDKGVKVETSLTSNEDDYGTDVAMEVARDSIKYLLIIPANQNINNKYFNLLGNKFKILSASSRYRYMMTIEVNGKSLRVKDGDAFIGENPDDPKWVWDIDINNKKPIIGIENNFIYNDDSDNPPKIGECIYLPNKYAKICLNGLTVDESTVDSSSSRITIEYVPNVNLKFDDSTENENSGSVSVLIAPGVKISSDKNPFKLSSLSSNVLSNDIWVTADGKIFYQYKLGKTMLMGNAPKTVFINDDLTLGIFKKGDQLYAEISKKGLDTVSPWFKINNEKITSLGNTLSLEETNELYYIYKGNGFAIGTKDEDHRTAYGIIIRNPKAHGSEDKVVLDIPGKQVYAQMSMSSSSIPLKHP